MTYDYQNEFRRIDGEYQQIDLVTDAEMDEAIEGIQPVYEQDDKLRKIMKNGDYVVGLRPRNDKTSRMLRENPDLVKRLKKYYSDKEKNWKINFDRVKAKEKAILGLKEIREAQAERAEFNRKFNEALGDEYSRSLPKEPTTNIEELLKTYPVAKAYQEIEDYQSAKHWAKATAGRKAMERFLDGEDYEEVLKDMREEWRKSASESVMRS